MPLRHSAPNAESPKAPHGASIGGGTLRGLILQSRKMADSLTQMGDACYPVLYQSHLASGTKRFEQLGGYFAQTGACRLANRLYGDGPGELPVDASYRFIRAAGGDASDRHESAGG